MEDSTSTTKLKSVIPKFITSKITNRKMNRDSYLQWRKIVAINLPGHGKKSHLYVDHLVLKWMSGKERIYALWSVVHVSS